MHTDPEPQSPPIAGATDRPVTMVELPEIPGVSDKRRPGRGRFWLVGAAAAVVLLVAGFLAFNPDNTEPALAAVTVIALLVVAQIAVEVVIASKADQIVADQIRRDIDAADTDCEDRDGDEREHRRLAERTGSMAGVVEENGEHRGSSLGTGIETWGDRTRTAHAQNAREHGDARACPVPRATERPAVALARGLTPRGDEGLRRVAVVVVAREQPPQETE